MTLPERYRTPKPHGSPRLVIGATMVWKLNHGLAPIKLSAVNYAPRPLLHDLHRGSLRWP